jgi:hypothetical protein
MTAHGPTTRSRIRHIMQRVAALSAVALMGVAGGCSNVVIVDTGNLPESTFWPPELLGSESNLDKIDLVLMLDNSRSMADKQEILKQAVPDLVRGLVNPSCIDLKTKKPTAMQPSSPLDNCPSGSKREFPPVLDFHIGIISSSLGGHGADTCLTTETVQKACATTTLPNLSNNDRGHLVSRSNACGGPNLPTYKADGKNDFGFLAWDPQQKLTPPGEADLAKLIGSLGNMVTGVGQIGCGFEASLESWYRFLVDPNPYDTISYDKVKQVAVPAGKDTVLLAQRAEFLRPTSLVAIIMLTDENDCSVKDGGIAFYAIQHKQPGDNTKFFHFPRARAECETDPGNTCCRSCTAPQDGCPPDPNCSDPVKRVLTPDEDPLNLRCWDQKRRFGYEFLQPIDRYRDALQADQIADRDGNMVPNPLYAEGRNHSLVFLAGIVGVPWQLIARDNKTLTKGFKSFDELNAKEADGTTTWQKILGDPTKYVPATDPHMIESRLPRMGLPGVMSPPTADPYNGHEYTPDSHSGDLQYACIFKLPTSRSCAGQSDSCDCTTSKTDNPLCDPTSPMTQVNAKAYPGLRELAAIQAVTTQGIVASVCPAQTYDKNSADYGYRPAIGSILDRLKPIIEEPCLPFETTPDERGLVSCVVIEGHNKVKPTDACCDPTKARINVAPEHMQLEKQTRATPLGKAKHWDCMCEVVQTGSVNPDDPTSKDALKACQTDTSEDPELANGKNVEGWCYLDANTQSPTGNPELVECFGNGRIIRFVGARNPGPETAAFISCDRSRSCFEQGMWCSDASQCCAGLSCRPAVPENPNSAKVCTQ